MMEHDMGPGRIIILPRIILSHPTLILGDRHEECVVLNAIAT